MSDTQRLTRLDFEHVWHPFTPMRQWRQSSPLIIERAEGFELISADGRRLIDGHSSLWCNVHGHRAPEIDDAIRAQLDKVAHATMLGCATIPAIELAASLTEIAGNLARTDNAPRLNKVFYSDAGATATEAAFKMAIGHFYHTGQRRRNTLVGVSGAYHGDTVGAMSVGFSDVFHRPFTGLTFDCAWAPAPDVRCLNDAIGNAGEWPSWDKARMDRACEIALLGMKRTLDDVGDRCAAVVVEPLMQGASGMIEQPRGYLAGVEKLTRDHGALLIADEVAVGLTRTGSMFACEQEGVAPDIMCLGKGLSGGYLPLAATLATDEIALSFEGEPNERRTLYHGHTFTGNPLACAAALASLDLIGRRDVLGNVRRNADLMRRRLREGLGDHPHVGDVRQRGVMVGIELVADRTPWTPLAPASGAASAVCDEAQRRGLLIRPLGDVIILNPAPAMDQLTLERLLSILIESIRRIDFSGVSQ